MDGHEFNKIAAAVLSALLLMFGTTTFLEIWRSGQQAKTVGYTLPAPKVASLVGGGAVADTGPSLPKVAEMMAKSTAEAGAGVFKKCTSCHSPEKGGKNGTGPNLWGVIGRKVAATDGFNYSSALKAKGGEWTWDALLPYLVAPAAAVPGNKMAFAGVKDAGELADLLVYLRTLSDTPAAMPK
jgi:cytochrome c